MSHRQLISCVFILSIILFISLYYFKSLKGNTLSVRVKEKEDKPKRMKSSHVMNGKPKKMNVLFMMMDGFRTEIGAYMHLIEEQPWLNVKVKTPNLDKLAAEGILFERAYSQFGRCSASRSSMFVGRRPDSTHVNLQSWVRESAGENLITLPQYFRENGYRTYGFGKTFCPAIGRGDHFDKRKSWDVVWQVPKESTISSWLSYPEQKQKTNPLLDDIIVKNANTVIDDHKNNTKPFFLFVGFKKPHLPMIVPKKYFELYPAKEMKRAVNEYLPKNIPDSIPGYHNNDELFYYNDISPFKKGWTRTSTFPNKTAVNLRRAYYACITYIDHQIGIIMKKLKESKLKKKTIVVFAADHGVHLGENGLWGKDTSFEISNRIPLLVTIPEVTRPKSRSRNFVELVDIFPTLIEAAQLPLVPMCPKDSNGWAFCTEGVSLLPIIKGQEALHWKNRVFWNGRWQYNSTVYKAYTVRTEEYRYTEYVESTHGAPKEWPITPFASELYDKALDPGENVNLWNNKSYVSAIKDLSEKLHNGWMSALPNT